jgi:hypothetical protein
MPSELSVIHPGATGFPDPAGHRHGPKSAMYRNGRAVRFRPVAAERLLEIFPVNFPVLSSTPGVAGPAGHETRLPCGGGDGTEVGNRLVRLSPFLSWTRGSLSTSDCRHGPLSVPEHAY